jgi:two-component system, OmpR family, response regulator
MTPLKLTVIDDDRNFLQVISLMFEDFEVKTFHCPKEGLAWIKESPPDAIVLDLHLQETDGFSVCKEIRQMGGEQPIFFLSCDVAITSIEQGYELGCVDYLSKGLPCDELRIRVIQRLLQLQNLRKDPNILNCGGLSMNLDLQSVSFEGRPLPLSPKELQLLKFFMVHQNKVITTPDLLTNLWSGVHVDPNNIDTHIFNLRKKLTFSSPRLETRKGLGYILLSE